MSKAWVKIAFLVLLSGPVMAQMATPKVVIALGLLKYNDLEILRYKFFKPLFVQLGVQQDSEKICATGTKELIKTTAFDLEIQCKASVTDLLTSVQDPSVQGFMFIGHPGFIRVLDEKTQKKEIKEFFLVTHDETVVPKNILSAMHSKMSFLALITCNGQSVHTEYFKSLKQMPTIFFKATPIAEAGSESPVADQIHMLTWPDEVLAQWKEWQSKADLQSAALVKHNTLTIEYRDLLSRRYGYEVVLNNQLVGVLGYSESKPGRPNNKAAVALQVPSELVQKNNNLVLRPVGLSRLEYIKEKIIDDILIDKITFDKQVLLDRTVHLGDETENWDVSSKTSFAINQDAFAKAPLSLELNLNFGVTNAP